MIAGSVYAKLVETAGKFPGSDLFVLPSWLQQQWQLPQSVWSYTETVDIVNRNAAAYAAAGYGPGQRVALLLENRPDHFFHYLALNSLGVSVVPVNPDYKDDETQYLLEHSESVALIVVPSRLEQVARVAAEVGVPVGLSHEPPPQPSRPPSGGTVGLQAEAAILYTSGSTGRPKGCVLTNAYFYGWGEWYMEQGGYIALQPGQERVMQPLPTFHTNGMGNSFMGMLFCGGAQIIFDRFHPRSWWKDAVETGATCMHYLGVMPAMLLNVPPGEYDKAHKVRFGLGGGVHPSHHALFEERFGTKLLEGWAMTEGAGATVLMMNEEPRNIGTQCIGRPRADTEIRIVDDNDNDVPPHQPGEFLVRAAGPDKRRRFFSGYLKDQAATDAVWKGEWFRTGDIVRLAENGCLYFVDRKKNLIRRSGENISTAEVEGALAAHPQVSEMAVVAVLDEIRGEEVMAALSLQPGATADRAMAEDIFQHCLSRMAYYKVPGYIAFLDQLPKTSTQKIRKVDLGDLVVNPTKHANCFDLREVKQASRTKKSA